MDNPKNRLKSYKVVCEMLRDRGFSVPEREFEEEINIKNTIKVIWIDDKITKEIIQNILEIMENDEIMNVIVICSENPSLQTNTTINRLRQQGRYIEIFSLKQVLFNPTKHKIVPKHILCEKTTIERVCDEWGCKPEHIPKISVDDPISKYYGACHGHIFKIIRPSETLSGNVLTYRIVV